MSVRKWHTGKLSRREYKGHGYAEIDNITTDGWSWILMNPLGFSRVHGVAKTLAAAQRAAHDEAKRLGWCAK